TMKTLRRQTTVPANADATQVAKMYQSREENLMLRFKTHVGQMKTAQEKLTQRYQSAMVELKRLQAQTQPSM
ncbi:hypothetical protein KIPB_009712, partial [Kipferlia bialata]